MKKFFFVLASVFLLILITLSLAPSLLSTNWGKRKILLFWNRNHKEKIAIQDLGLSWFGSQSIRGLQIIGEKKAFIFECPFATTDAPLWKLLISRKNIGNVVLEKPFFRLEKQWVIKQPPASKKIKEAGFTPKLEWSSSNQSFFSFHGDIKIHQGKIELSPRGLVPVVFDSLQAQISDTALTLQGMTQQAEIQGDFALTGVFRKDQLSFKGIIHNLPVLGIDQIAALFHPEFRGIFVEAIGPSFQLQTEGTISSETVDLRFDASSAKFTAQIETQKQENQITLKNPAAISLSLTPELFQKLSKASSFFQKLPLLNATKAEIDITRLSVPLNEGLIDLAHSGAQASFQLMQGSLALIKGNLNSQNFEDKMTIEARINQIPLESHSLADFLGPSLSAHLVFHGNLQEGKIGIAAKGARFQLPEAHFTWKEGLQLDAPVTCQLKEGTLSLEKLYLPASLEISKLQLIADLKAAHFFTLNSLTAHIDISTFDSISLKTESPNLKTDLLASLTDDLLSIIKPISIEASIPPELINPRLPFNIIFSKPLGIHLQLEPFSVPISTMDMKTLKMQGTGTTSALAFKNSITSKNTTLDPLTFTFKSQGSSGSFSFESTHLDGSCSFQPANLKSTLNFKNFPTNDLDLFLPKDRTLVTSLGPSINFHLAAENKGDNTTISLKGNSQRLILDASLVKTPSSWELTAPAKCQFTIDEELYALLDQALSGQKQSPYIWQAPAICKASISSLKCPLDPEHFLSQCIASGIFSIDELSLQDKATRKSFGLEKIAFSIDKTAENGPLAFTLSGQPIQGSRDGLMQIKGACNLTTNSISLNGKMQLFPARLLDACIRFAKIENRPFSTLFGDTLNATAAADISLLSGPLTLNISSPSSRASLVGKLQQGVLTLSEPIYAQLSMTTELSNFLFKETNPLGITGITAENPLTLQISPEGFSVPLNPLNWKKASVSHARLELGKISCQNKGNINITLGLLKSTKLTEEKQLHLWFAPVDLRIMQGIIDCERTEILVANTYEIATWGKLDLGKNRVDMVLGLTSQCLKKAFGIKNLPHNYVLQIPLTGTLDNVEISTAKATGKIALLLAWQQKSIAGGLAGGPAGALLGELFNKIGALPDFNAKAPPAKHPFPWEKPSAAGFSPQSPRHIKKKAIKKKDKPLKQLLKIIR